MCGISGIVSFDSSNCLINYIVPMNRVLAHRGPDDEGIVFFSGNTSEPAVFGGESTPKSVFYSQQPYCPDKPFADQIPSHAKLVFGHRRLSILDLSAAGHQPMCTEDGRYWIVYNGEIYNFKEIRNSLIKTGENFFSDTDTEVLLKAFRLWGHECLSFLNGMWAFVIFDRANKNIFISRDRFGKKPLYYYLDHSIFAFASEIKALLEVPAVKTEADIQYCVSYIEHGRQEFGSTTAFANIYSFTRGSYAYIALDELATQGFQTKKFWNLSTNLSDEPFDKLKARQYAKEYYNLLLDSVSIRLRADVRVGSALSGGLDSSSIVYLVNRLLDAQGRNDKQVTFSSVYKSRSVRYCDESYFIEKIGRYLDIESRQIEPKVDDIPAEHRKMIYAMDCPPEGTCMSGWHTFKCAQMNNVKVSLDGQGADEQLAGYLSYIVTYLSNLKKDLFRESWNLLSIPEAKTVVSAAMTLNLAKRLIPANILKVLIRRTPIKRDPYQSLNQRLVEDTTHSLIVLIHYSDRVSMAHSVESRMPFLDYRLVEYLASIPASYKINNGWTKFIARLAMDKKLPDEITWRKDKMGWPVPENYWFRNPLKQWFSNTLTDSYFLKHLGYSLNINQHAQSARNLSKLIRMLNLAVWHDVFFNSHRNANQS